MRATVVNVQANTDGGENMGNVKHDKRMAKLCRALRVVKRCLKTDVIIDVEPREGFKEE